MSTHASAHIVFVGLMCGCEHGGNKYSWVWLLTIYVCILLWISVWVCVWVCVVACMYSVCVCVCLCVCHCVYTSQRPFFLLMPHSLRSRKITLAVSLADVAGRSPGDRRGETIPTKWHELMWLINTTLIICKLHVWVRVTWEAYAACCVRPNKCQLICISGVPHVWRRANPLSAGKRKREEEREREKKN